MKKSYYYKGIEIRPYAGQGCSRKWEVVHPEEYGQNLFARTLEDAKLDAQDIYDEISDLQTHIYLDY